MKNEGRRTSWRRSAIKETPCIVSSYSGSLYINFSFLNYVLIFNTHQASDVLDVFDEDDIEAYEEEREDLKFSLKIFLYNNNPDLVSDVVNQGKIHATKQIFWHSENYIINALLFPQNLYTFLVAG